MTERNPYPDDDDLVEVKFAKSPIMSTYLVAFVVGEYDFVEAKSSDGILVRVYTPIGKAEQGKFALEVVIVFVYSCMSALNWEGRSNCRFLNSSCHKYTPVP